ncbi:MAG: hypothetical protein ACRCW3_00025 [Metamycoplasmataceae bacterium]
MDGNIATKDWSNDAQKLALITGINYTLKYIRIEKLVIINVKHIS